MKTKQYAIAIATSLGMAAASQAALTTGLLAYYDFEETGTAGLANKAPGATSFDGTWSGAFDGPDQDGPGFGGNAAYNPGDGLSDRSNLLVGNALNIVDLNGTFADMPIGVADTGKSLTVAFWGYLAPGASNGSARFHAFETGDSGVYDLSVGTAGNYSTTGRNDYAVYGPSNNQIGANVANSYTEESWHHHVITTTVVGNDITNAYYLDGVLTRSETVTNAALGTNFAFTGLHFGDGRAGSGERDWDGLIDEAAIWDRALSASEVSDLHTLGSNGTALVPEPSSAALLGLGGLAFVLRRRKG